MQKRTQILIPDMRPIKEQNKMQKILIYTTMRESDSARFIKMPTSHGPLAFVGKHVCCCLMHVFHS